MVEESLPNASSSPSLVTVTAGDIANEIDLESASTSFNKLDLELVDKHAKVQPGTDVVKCKKTGRYYYRKEKKPDFSLARSKGAARIDHSTYHGAPIGLAHSMPHSGGLSRRSSMEGSHGRTTPPVMESTAAVLDQLRILIRDEIRNATRGHADELRQHMNDAIEQAGEVTVAKRTSSDTDTRINVTSPSTDALQSEKSSTQLEEEDGDQQVDFPNPWARIRYKMREPFAEFLACFVLITFGDGINVQVVASSLYNPDNPKGSYLSISFGWGIAVMMAVYVSGGISGGHINPGVTLALACFRGFPFRKVPIYIAAQLAGAIMGALCIYGLYSVPLRIIDPDQTEVTASLFTTYPATFLRGSPALRAMTAYNEIYASAILLIVIFAIGDSGNAPPTEGMSPLVLMWLITGIGATLGWQTAYAVNPIRDWGPRIALTIVGYEGLWSFDDGYFAYTPMASAICGALLGAFIYDVLMYTGGESWVNKPWSLNKPKPKAMSKKKMPMALETEPESSYPIKL